MEDILLTPKELADHLRVPLSWVYGKSRLKGHDTIPVIRVGKYCRFRLSEVVAWLEKKQIGGENDQ